jgi:tellurite resistance protein TerC
MTLPLWIWGATVAGIGTLVAIDIWQVRRPHEVGFREALGWSVAYIAAAVVFGLGLLVLVGPGPATEFFAGYLVEKSLSVDNLFVFAVVLAQFAVPARHQQRVLLIGVLGALALRAVFIAVGAAAVQRYAITFLFFGAFLVYTAVQLVRSYGRPPDIGASRGMRLLRRILPVTDRHADGRLFTRVGGRRMVTPLFLAVAAILAIDIVFALDSIPAIFGITDNAYLVFTTNAFALLGLRPLYLLLVGLLDRLVHLHYGLAVILGFIGVKLTLHYLHTLWPGVPEIPTMLSLTAIIGILAIVTVTSLARTKRTPAETAPERRTEAETERRTGAETERRNGAETRT